MWGNTSLRSLKYKFVKVPISAQVPPLREGDDKCIRHYENSLKQLKMASTNSPWAHIQAGLLSEGFLRLRFRGLIFRRAYIFFFFGGGGGGAY